MKWYERPNLPGHNHPKYPPDKQQQNICLRKDTMLCAGMGGLGCRLCLAPECPACHAQWDADMEAARQRVAARQSAEDRRRHMHVVPGDDTRR